MQQAATTPAIDPRHLRRLILEQSHRARVGHIGSSLSVADILAALYGGVLRSAGSADPDRDRFVLSKGHAALALYCTLALAGLLEPALLDTYCADGSLLGVHPEHQLPGVDHSTGSLGQGLSAAAGMALGARLRGSPARVYALLSDAELNEGSVWEAVMFAAHQRLDNLAAIVDLNGQQALGRTADVIDLSPVGDRWAAFGWRVLEVDGHDAAAIGRALLAGMDGRPLVVLARTTSGRGVSFMEGQVAWHYLPLDDDQFRRALAEVAG